MKLWRRPGAALRVTDSNLSTYSSPAVVEAYARQADLQPAESVMFTRFASRLGGATLLDLGCGGGRLTRTLSELASNYVGVDYSREMVEACRVRYPHLNFICADARDLGPLESATFDVVVFAFNGLDYIPHEGRVTALREIRRVLRDEGLFIFSTHNRRYSRAHAPPALKLRRIHWRSPLDNVRALGRFARQRFHHLRYARHEVESGVYSIWNDSAWNYTLLTHYIDMPSQIDELLEAGFRTVAMYATDGSVLHPGDEDSESPWVYFASEKLARVLDVDGAP